jgi:hypothetical protein
MKSPAERRREVQQKRTCDVLDQVHFQRFGATWVPDVLFLGEEDFSPLTPDLHPSAVALRTGLDNWDDRDAHQLQNLIHALLLRCVRPSQPVEE